MSQFSNNKSKKSSNNVPYSLLAVLLTLYFAQGLPAGFITQALPAILREYNVSLELIGLSGLILLPWAFKFLWAPLVDRYYFNTLGRSRSWVIPLQLISAALVVCVGFFNPYDLSSPTTLWTVYFLLFLLSLSGSTHDVAADGLATRALSLLKSTSKSNLQSFNHRFVYYKNPSYTSNLSFSNLSFVIANRFSSKTTKVHNPFQGMGNAVQVIGYRLGLILGGGVFLLVLSEWSWRYSFFAMAILIVLNTLPIWFYNENKQIPIIVHKPYSQQKLKPTQVNYLQNKSVAAKFNFSRIKQYITVNYGYFWQNTHMRSWLYVLLTFKVVDGISSGMVKPMMVDMGIPTRSIGLWGSVLGSMASLLGAAIAALLLKRFRPHNALVAFNMIQVATTALYVMVAVGFEHPLWFNLSHHVPFWWAYAANAIEHMAAAMALVAMLTMVMHYARHDKAGSDFTTQVCILTLFSGGSHLISGYLAEWFGYTGHFSLSVAIGVLCLIPLIYWRYSYINLNNQISS